MLSVALTCRRRNFTVDVQLDVGPGEILGLFGPSGAGKSTLLAAIAGLVRPRAGQVRLGQRVLTDLSAGRPVHLPPWQRQIGFVTQELALFPHLTVEANVAYGLPGRRLDRPAHELIAALGIGHLLRQRVQEISGGERRRVALAQTLAIRPGALLLDEPFTALDAPVRTTLGDLVRSLQQRANLPTIFVSHDLEEVQRLSDRIAIMVAGKLLQVGTPREIVRHPASPVVAQLVGYTSLLPAELLGLGRGLVSVHPDRVRVGRFPEIGPVVEAVVIRSVPYRAAFRVWGRVGEDSVVEFVVPSGHPAPDEGQAIPLTLVEPPLFPVPTAGGMSFASVT